MCPPSNLPSSTLLPSNPIPRAGTAVWGGEYSHLHGHPAEEEDSCICSRTGGPSQYLSVSPHHCTPVFTAVQYMHSTVHSTIYTSQYCVHSTVHISIHTSQYCVHYSTVHSTIQYSTQYYAVQYTVLYSTVHSTIQYSTQYVSSYVLYMVED